MLESFQAYTCFQDTCVGSTIKLHLDQLLHILEQFQGILAIVNASIGTEHRISIDYVSLWDVVEYAASIIQASTIGVHSYERGQIFMSSPIPYFFMGEGTFVLDFKFSKLTTPFCTSFQRKPQMTNIVFLIGTNKSQHP